MVPRPSPAYLQSRLKISGQCLLGGQVAHPRGLHLEVPCRIVGVGEVQSAGVRSGTEERIPKYGWPSTSTVNSGRLERWKGRNGRSDPIGRGKRCIGRGLWLEHSSPYCYSPKSRRGGSCACSVDFRSVSRSLSLTHSLFLSSSEAAADWS